MPPVSADELRAKSCVSCEGGVPKYSPSDAEAQLSRLTGWRMAPGADKIHKEWKVANFLAGLDFFQHIGQLAEAEGHHPDLHLTSYRNVTIELTTHAIGGLSQNDFILAAKIDTLAVDGKPKN